MMESSTGGEDVRHAYVPPAYAPEAQAGSGTDAAPSEIAPPNGEEGEHLFALRMPRASREQLRMLGALAQTFGWDLVPVVAQAASPIGVSSVVQERIAEPAGQKEVDVDPEAVAYMTKYADLKEGLDTIASRGYAYDIGVRKAFTEEEKRAFRAAGYKSVVELVSVCEPHRITVYAYEDVPGLDNAFKVTRQRRHEGQPLSLHTLAFHASGGTSTFQEYARKSFGRVELQPPIEGDCGPMTHYDLDTLKETLFGKHSHFERLRGGTWQKDDELAG